MEKGIKIILLVIVSTFLLSAMVFADNPITKLSRGAINILASPLEIFHGIKQAKDQGAETSSLLPSGGVDSAIIWGPLNGLARMTMRAAVGAYEVVTFLIPIPADYKPIITDVKDPKFFL